MIEATQVQKAAQEGGSATSTKNFHEHPMVLAFFLWWFEYVPGRVWDMMAKIIVKLYDFFSITLLFNTLTQPWKKDEIDASNLPFDEKIRIWMMNLISIFIGFTVRSITILIGFTAITGVFLLSVAFLVIFYALPFFCLFMIYLGLKV